MNKIYVGGESEILKRVARKIGRRKIASVGDPLADPEVKEELEKTLDVLDSYGQPYGIHVEYNERADTNEVIVTCDNIPISIEISRLGVVLIDSGLLWEYDLDSPKFYNKLKSLLEKYEQGVKPGNILRVDVSVEVESSPESIYLPKGTLIKVISYESGVVEGKVLYVPSTEECFNENCPKKGDEISFEYVAGVYSKKASRKIAALSKEDQTYLKTVYGEEYGNELIKRASLEDKEDFVLVNTKQEENPYVWFYVGSNDNEIEKELEENGYEKDYAEIYLDGDKIIPDIEDATHNYLDRYVIPYAIYWKPSLRKHTPFENLANRTYYGIILDEGWDPENNRYMPKEEAKRVLKTKRIASRRASFSPLDKKYSETIYGDYGKELVKRATKRRAVYLSRKEWDLIHKAVDDVVDNYEKITGVNPIELFRDNGELLFNQDLIDENFPKIKEYIKENYPDLYEDRRVFDQFLYSLDDELIDRYAYRTASKKATKRPGAGRTPEELIAYLKSQGAPKKYIDMVKDIAESGKEYGRSDEYIMRTIYDRLPKYLLKEPTKYHGPERRGPINSSFRKAEADLTDYFYDIEDDIMTALDLYNQGDIEESERYIQIVLDKTTDLLQEIENLE